MLRFLSSFVPTPRLAALVLLGAPLLAVSVRAPVLVPVAIGWEVLLLGIALLDFAYASRRRLSVRREVDAKLSLGADNEVRLVLRNEGAGEVRLRARDDCPEDLQPSLRESRLRIAAGAEGEMRYRVRPTRRGDYAFGDVAVRASSELGLCEVQRSLPAGRPVKVYPNLQDVRKFEVLVRHSSLRQAGIRRTRMRGVGTEFESLRDHVPDDEHRRIDWKATARRGKLTSREYEQERSQNIVVMIDAGRMMSAELERMSKLDHAINAALMLTYVGGLRGDNVGVLAFSDDVEVFLPPRKGKAHLSRIVEALYRIESKLCEPDYAAAFGHLSRRLRKRSLVVLFTDLIDVQASRLLLAYLAGLTPRHLPLCVAIADPIISRMAAQTPASAEDVYEKAAAEQVLGERQVALATLRRSGAIAIDVPPERLSPEVINTYLALKAEGRL
jgi:uncharacterized protein (DUF58 family)